MSDIVLPRLGWNMEEGVFLGWLKRDGDVVKIGDPLFTLEGDKSVQDVEATESGILRISPQCPQNGDIVPVGTRLGFLETAIAEGSPSEQSQVQEAVHSETDIGESPDRQRITPRARRAAQEHQVDLTILTGTGRNGRIRERDVLATISQSAKADQHSIQRATPLRQAIAQQMRHSLHVTAPVTLTTSADASNLVSLRDQFKALAMSEQVIVPSITDLFVKLTAQALQLHPYMNARWENDNILTVSEIHIGVAVDTEAGLLVPVIRDVSKLTTRKLAVESKKLIEKARARRLSPAEMQGGTFTITNLGVYGIDAFTPIINWPECAILGVGTIRKQPVVVDNQIVIRDTVVLSLTFDHRLVDGAPASRFLETLRLRIENPAAWLVE